MQQFIDAAKKNPRLVVAALIALVLMILFGVGKLSFPQLAAALALLGFPISYSRSSDESGDDKEPAP